MKIEHNSRNLFYRNPFGAVTNGQAVTIRLGIAEGGIPNAVRLVLMGSGETNFVNMPYLTDVGEYCIYEATVKMPLKPGLVWYYFEVSVEDKMIYYGNNEKGLGAVGKISDVPPEKSFQITVYDPDYQTPEWFRESVAYQIFVDRFYNGNEDGSFLGKRQDIIKRQWGDIPYYKAEQFGSTYLSNDFFGGNLKGVIKKLPYLADLGVGVVYLNPIFRAYTNHKYDTGNYMEIDPMFGDEETFEELCQTAQQLGIRIILDGVFNHTGSDSIYFNKYGHYDSVGAYQSKESPYYPWYKFIQYPDVYESWWGMTTLPHVDETTESYQTYILTDEDSVVKHWLKKGASGWRLDVVDELPDFFVQILRREAKKQKEDAVIIGEVWEDASNKCSYGEQRQYFMGEELDSVMNYPLRNMIIDFALGRIDAEGFDERIMSLKENYPRPAFYALLNFLSSHDVERILTMMGDAPDRNTISKTEQATYHLYGDALQLARRRVQAAVAMQMLLPGVPCIYYGDEAGMQGYADPFCRQTYPWGHEDEEMMSWYKSMVSIRNSSRVYMDGEFETVYKIGRVYGFIRYDEHERVIVLVNFHASDLQRIRLDVARYGVFHIENELSDEELKSHDGVFYIDLPPNSVKLFSVMD
jgi:cyclomaltodextrinase